MFGPYFLLLRRISDI